MALTLTLSACRSSQVAADKPALEPKKDSLTVIVPEPIADAMLEPARRKPIPVSKPVIKKETEFETTLKDAGDRFAAEKYEEALSLYRRALVLNPDYAPAKSMVAKSQQKLSAKIKDMHRKGTDAYLDENYDLAIDYFDKVLTIDPDYRAAKDYKDRAVKKRDALRKLK
ncbi:MAG: hypothetical protein IAF08_07825 [Rhizobacter sp.]|nr:hypothetical protein [Chlorobiales bacterium]